MKKVKIINRFLNIPKCAINFIIISMNFYLLGYALDPTVDSTEIIGRKPEDTDEFKTVFESMPKRPADKRKRHKNDNPEDIEGYLGPWGCYVDEQKIAKPEGVSQLYVF